MQNDLVNFLLVSGGCVTCSADHPSCVPMSPSSDSIGIVIIKQISPCACIGVTSSSQHVPECVQQDTVHQTVGGVLGLCVG